ncbi:MAG: succinate dehydrogenase assembly factor 2 [Paracoccaceae bacterium]
MTDETREIRLKRLRIRSWRRGMKEMDLLLGPFSDGPIAALSSAELDAYEAMLEENDQDLYRWFSGASPMPEEHSEIISCIQKTRN